MDPGTITLTLLAASAASTGAGLIASGQQQKLDLARLNAETEQAKLQAADEAFVSARNFRQALASQLALSSLRSGSGGSLVRQFGAESVANMLEEQRVLTRRSDFIDLASNLNRANIKTARFSRDVSSIGSLLSSGIESINLNK